MPVPYRGPSPRLLLFAGIGFPPQFFDPQRAAFPQLEVARWIAPASDEFLPDYARRLAATIALPPGDPRPLYLGGVSFGGAVALEVSRHLPAAGVFLIAAARSFRGIPAYLRAIEHASRGVNDGLCQVLLSTAPFMLPQIESLSPEEERFFLPIFRSTPVSFIRWALRALMNWTFPTGAVRCPVHHIHGDQDLLVPLNNLPRGEVDEIARNGRHLINITHADLVNRFIAARMSPPRTPFTPSPLSSPA